MAPLQIKGKWQGVLNFDLGTATVDDLREAVSSASGMPSHTIKLLCGGRTLRTGTMTLAAAGVTATSRIMVLREGPVMPEPGAQEHKTDTLSNVNAVLDAAGRLAHNTVGRPDFRDTRLQLTNQEGQGVGIPEADAAALVEGMVLHSKARKVLAQACADLRRTSAAPSPAAAGALAQHPRQAGLRQARTEALQYLVAADAAFRRCRDEYRQSIDNHAHACLDAAWLLFLTRDMANLSQASAFLTCAAEGFQRSHGSDLGRLRALKGEHCPEFALYARLHLLQGVVALLLGDDDTAVQLLLRANSECTSLRVRTQDVHALQAHRHVHYGETLSHKLAARALRAGKGSTAGANEFLEVRRQRLERVSEEQEAERQRRRFGRTANGNQYVDPTKVAQQVSMGVPEQLAVHALKMANNFVDEAMNVLVAPPTPADDGTGARGRSNAHAAAAPQPPASGAQVPQHEQGGRLGGDMPGEGEGAGEGEGEGEESEEEEEEDTELFDELAHTAGAGSGDEGADDEEHLDCSLREESLAARMYLLICTGKVPLSFDLERIRAAIMQATST